MSENPGLVLPYATPVAPAPAPVVISAVKAASTPRTSAVPADDPDLVLSFDAGEFDFSAMLAFEGSDRGLGGLRFSWTTSTFGLIFSTDGTDPEGHPVPDSTGGRDVTLGTAGTGKRCAARISGRLVVAEPGTLGLNWSQAVSNGTPTILHSGSSCKLTKIS